MGCSRSAVGLEDADEDRRGSRAQLMTRWQLLRDPSQLAPRLAGCSVPLRCACERRRRCGGTRWRKTNTALLRATMLDAWWMHPAVVTGIRACFGGRGSREHGDRYRTEADTSRLCLRDTRAGAAVVLGSVPRGYATTGRSTFVVLLCMRVSTEDARALDVRGRGSSRAQLQAMTRC